MYFLSKKILPNNRYRPVTDFRGTNIALIYLCQILIKNFNIYIVYAP